MKFEEAMKSKSAGILFKCAVVVPYIKGHDYFSVTAPNLTLINKKESSILVENTLLSIKSLIHRPHKLQTIVTANKSKLTAAGLSKDDIVSFISSKYCEPEELFHNTDDSCWSNITDKKVDFFFSAFINEDELLEYIKENNEQ